MRVALTPLPAGGQVVRLRQAEQVEISPPAAMERSGNDFVDQFIHGRAEGPIQMEVRAL